MMFSMSLCNLSPRQQRKCPVSPSYGDKNCKAKNWKNMRTNVKISFFILIAFELHYLFNYCKNFSSLSQSVFWKYCFVPLDVSACPRDERSRKLNIRIVYIRRIKPLYIYLINDEYPPSTCKDGYPSSGYWVLWCRGSAVTSLLSPPLLPIFWFENAGLGWLLGTF